MTDLTPTELSTLNATGSVRVVRAFEEQPSEGWEPHGPRCEIHQMDSGEPNPDIVLGKGYCNYDGSEGYVIPFPPAGTREVIDGVPCVWGEVECKQRGVLKNNEVVPIDPERPVSVEAFTEWAWVTTIRKDETE